MNTGQDLAIILKSVAFEDKHKIVTAITEKHGKITAMARNAIGSRRFGGGLDLFCASLWTFSIDHRTQDHSHTQQLFVHLNECQVKHDYRDIHTQFEKLSLASALNEILLHFTFDSHHGEEIFKLHSNALKGIEETPSDQIKNLFAILNSYCAKILQSSGHQPILHQCRTCLKPLRDQDPDLILRCYFKTPSWVCASCVSFGKFSDSTTPGQTGHNEPYLNLPARAIFAFYLYCTTPVRQAPVSSSALTTLEDELLLYRFLESIFYYHIPGFDKIELKSLKALNLFK